MPRIGAEPERRMALISAAIDMIGDHGSLDVPVKQIASRAGMSSALAFHYFGGKDGIVTETMRHLLREFTSALTAKLKTADSCQRRLEAVIETSFSPDQFERKTVAAWLVFYLHAYTSPAAARLLSVYRRRLHSNLVSALRPLCEAQNAQETAHGLGALIDGIYIRQGLDPDGPDAAKAAALCRMYLSNALGSDVFADQTGTRLPKEGLH